MKISGRDLADRILISLKQEIIDKKLRPILAIILAGEDPASEIYVSYKIKAAKEIGVQADLYRFSKDQYQKCAEKIGLLSADNLVSGIIIQHPVFPDWDFDQLLQQVNLKKDVDGFLSNSPFLGATALGIWEMLGEFAKIEGFKKTEDFLQNKKIVLLGKGRAAGKPTMRLFANKEVKFTLIDSKTQSPDEIIKSADVVISCTGKEHIIRGESVKQGSYIIGVGGKDVHEAEIAGKARLYCPNIDGIGPLTVACLLRNVVLSAHGLHGQFKTTR